MISFKQFLRLFEAERSPILIDYFKSSYKNFTHIDGVRDNLEEFFNCKKVWPQKILTSAFKDHRLSGDFYQKHKIMECHLAGDVLLLYF